jgi:hypothetical protein
VSNRKYEDTEDATFTEDPEAPSPNDGFASENSILGFFWDVWDANQDSSTVGGTSVTEILGGIGPKALWDLVTTTLPCNPCDRFDRFWNALTTMVPLSNPALFTVSNLLVVNKMAPQTTAPASGSAFGGGVPPKFEWVANGDPHADHMNDTFMLVFSRDHFDRHVFWLPVPTKGASSYTPTEAQWLQLQQGGTATDTYEWFVTAYASGDPQIPTGTPWYSNLRSFSVRSIHIRITWTPRGADVDLHLKPPTGQDIAYYNRAPGWGVLDRDCIDQCTEENISLISVPATGTYRAFAHYFSDHGKGPASVQAQVFESGQVVLDTSFTLEDTGDTADIFSVFVTAAGHDRVKITIEPSGRSGPYDGPPLPSKLAR